MVPDITPHPLRPGAARAPSLAGRLHEIHADNQDHAAAAAFALHLAGAAPAQRPEAGRAVLWVRGATHGCGLYGAGLAGLGIAPARLVIVHAEDGARGGGGVRQGWALLRAGLDGARCVGLGAVVIEGWGQLPAYDLTASRRLVLAAQTSGVGVVMLRGDAAPRASAAHVRWQVACVPSSPADVGVGAAAFTAEILRARGGPPGLVWQMTWDASDGCFRETLQPAGRTPLSGTVARPFFLRADGVGDARAA